MSFTAEVKDELSRVEGDSAHAALAELSALMRVCGTLSFHGTGRYSIRIATETGSVARTAMRLVHRYLDLQTTLTVRRSVQRKSRNYLIEIPEQDELLDDLVLLGILVPGRGLATGVPTRLLTGDAEVKAFVRAALWQTHARTFTWRLRLRARTSRTRSLVSPSEWACEHASTIVEVPSLSI